MNGEISPLDKAVNLDSVATQQIYAVVLQIHADTPCPDVRFTWFQAPVKVEDVLGRGFQFASECSVLSLDAEIKARFRDGPGQREVETGNYEIFDAHNSNNLLSISENSSFLPGMTVFMAIVVKGWTKDNGKCPMPRCTSMSFTEVSGGGSDW